jgi:chaperonin GroEL
VAKTLGPKGKVVVFKRGDTIFADDGVTIANQVELSDPIEAMGSDLVKDVASKTDNEAGDGTTTSIILSQFILKEGLKAIAAGVDTLVLRKGLSEALKIAVTAIKKIAKPVKNGKDISNIGTVASKDAEIGRIISEITGEPYQTPGEPVAKVRKSNKKSWIPVLLLSLGVGLLLGGSGGGGDAATPTDTPPPIPF